MPTVRELRVWLGKRNLDTNGLKVRPRVSTVIVYIHTTLRRSYSSDRLRPRHSSR